MTFNEWMRSKFWTYLPPDNSAQTRLLRQCWDAATAAQAERVAQPARQPLDRWHIADILARERMQWTKSQPLFEFEFGEAIVRAIERAHGIGNES